LKRSVAALSVLLAAYALAYFHRVMGGVLKAELDRYAAYYGVSADLLLSIFTSAYFYAYSAAQLVVGPLIDAYGVKRVTSALFALTALGSVMMLIPAPVALVVGRAMIGFSVASAFISYQRTASRGFSTGVQGTLTSAALVVGNLAGLLAGFPLRMAINWIGYSNTLIVLASAAALVALLTAYTSDDRGSASEGVKVLRGLRDIAGDLHIWGLGIGAIGSYSTALAFQTGWGQKYLQELFGFTIEEVSVAVTAISALLMVFAILAGFVSDRVLRRRKPVALAASVSALIAWIMLFVSYATRSRIQLYASIALMGVAMGLQSVMPTMAKEPYPKGVSASATALFNIQVFAAVAVLQTVAPLVNAVNALEIHLAVSLVGLIACAAMCRETLK